MDFRLPELGEGIYEAELVAWLVKDGDVVKRGHNLMEVLTDKASMEVPAPFAGTITGLLAEPGKQIKVGAVVLTYTPVGQQERVEEPEARSEDGKRSASQPCRPPIGPRVSATVASAVRAAPSVRYLARKFGVDLARVRGSGPGGRVLLDDLSAQVKAPGEDAQQPTAEVHADYGTPGTRIKLHGIRRKIAEHMVLAKRAPHYTYVDECDATDLVRLRDSLRDTFARAGARLTYLAFFVKAVAAALKEVPIVNSSLDEEAGEIVLYDHYHIGIAVSTPNGLIVPVIHDADRKDLTQIAEEIERLSTAARTGKARLEDLRGGTFTVTSVGGLGGLISTPVVNHPEVAILGIGRVVRRPVFDAAGSVRPADLVYLSLSCDHRVLDGAVAAAFANAVMHRIQNPAILLLPEKLR
jgi:pyruvate dehydrogenase E2 component (dihydrolipoamide acetyltransferase)/2-oxoisovalerate dehydrogenase E2 component (dihydrolipoyl transacylase)